MFDSLGKRILWLFSLLFLGCVLLTNAVGWYLLKTHLLQEGKIRFALLIKEVEDVLEEAHFNIELAKLKGFLNPLEIEILEKEEALSQISALTNRSEVKFLILEKGSPLAGDKGLLEQHPTPGLYKKIFFEPFSWEIYLAMDEKRFWQEIYRVLNFYFVILLTIIIVSLAVVYHFYRRWIKTPFETIYQALHQRKPPPTTGIKELDALCLHINQALEREKEWQKNLAFTEKMSALGVLAGGYAHEFNNLLQIIAGHLKLAQIWCERDSKEKALSRLKEAEKATLRGAEISQRILRLSRKEIGLQEQRSPVDKVIFHTLEALKRAFPKDIKISYQAEKGLFVPLSDDALQEIILNLALNARDAMGDRGELIIKAFRKGDHVVITVEDTGPGIPPELKTRIFEPFFTTKEVGKGTGLGLYVVHQLVTEAGGTIEIKEREGGGASFVITLPFSEPKPSSKEKETRETSLPRRKLKILVVDDEEEILKNVKEYLDVLGFEVKVARSAKEAKRLLEAESFDFLLVDLIMPGKGGDWLIRKLNSGQKTKVILMTGFTGEFHEKIEDLLAEGLVVEILRKPFQIDTLKDLFQRLDAS